METGRELMCFPIIHTAADMGALREQVERLKVARVGRQAFRQGAAAVDRLWAEIEQAALKLPLDYPRVRVYQDGLPECGRELEIVEDLARSGSRNHRLLVELHRRGAAIMGTESPELLIQEYELMSEALAAGDSRSSLAVEARQWQMRDELLARRDRYIAARINSTLGSRETGLLFLGMLHNITGLLDRDILVRFPVHRFSGPGGRP